jgi:hypothetical protein
MRHTHSTLSLFLSHINALAQCESPNPSRMLGPGHLMVFQEPCALSHLRIKLDVTLSDSAKRRLETAAANIALSRSSGEVLAAHLRNVPRNRNSFHDSGNLFAEAYLLPSTNI